MLLGDFIIYNLLYVGEKFYNMKFAACAVERFYEVCCMCQWEFLKYEIYSGDEKFYNMKFAVCRWEIL